MKRWAFLFILIILIGANCTANAGRAKVYSNNLPLNLYCSECKDQEINVDDDIMEYFNQTPIFIGLDECIAVAMMNNFNIKVSNAEYKSSKWQYRNALSQFLPNVEFDGYSIYYKGQVLVGGIVPADVEELSLSGTLNVSHDLTKGGLQIFEARAKKLTARANLSNLNFTKDTVILNTAQNYYELLRAKINIEIQLKNLYERTAQLKLTETLMEAGMGTRFDVVRSEGEQALAEQNYMSALNRFRSAQAKLTNIMGIEVNTHLFPIESEVNPITLVDEKITVDELYKTAEFTRDDVKNLQNRIKSLKQTKYGVYTDFIPKPRILYRGQMQGTARVGVYPNNAIGAYLDIPIGDRLGVGTITKAKAVQEQIESLQFQLEQKLRDIKQDIISNYYNSQILKERIEIAKKQVEYAQDSVKLAELRLDSGVGILIDVIQAQTIKNNARIELLSTVVDYNISQIRLLYDNGTISYENIANKYIP